MKAASSGTSKTCSSKALWSGANSDQTVPGTTAVMMANAASAWGSCRSSGTVTKALRGGRLFDRITATATSSAEVTTSRPTRRISISSTPQWRSGPGAGRSEASSNEPGDPVDLKAVAQDAAQDWVPRALERGADLGFQLEAAPVRGHRHLLGELLANLIHNALEYATGTVQRPARITVRTGVLRQQDGAPRSMFEVEDNGPGIAAEERARGC